MTPEWDAILRTHDQAILLMFAGVCAFALNWYAFEQRQPTVQKILTWMALLSFVIILILEVIK